MTILAKAASEGGSGRLLLAIAVLVGGFYFVLSLFSRHGGRWHCEDGPDNTGVWLLLVAILIGILATHGR